MGTATRIGLASRSPVERATLSQWLSSGGYQAVPVSDVGAPARQIEGLNFEILIVDAALLARGSLMRVARYRATPLPVIVISDGDPAVEIEAAQRGASCLVRPVERSALLLAVALALVEGRPMRRSPRKRVPRFPGLIDGVPSHVLDVSPEGVRLELAAASRHALPRSFTLRVPLFNLAVLVQRVWSSTVIVGTSSQLWCGGALGTNAARSIESWRRLVDMTPGVDGLNPTVRHL